MKAIKRNIPNAITCGNLFCGCLASIATLNGNLTLAAYLVGIAAILDFFDGFVARLLKVSSPIGKDLDSLADMVTFGLVPGLIMFQLIKSSVGILGDVHVNYLGNKEFVTTNLESYHFYLPYVALLIPIFSAIRLAKFNHDTRQSDQFIGLPTPANAIFISSFALLNKYETFYYSYDNFNWTIALKNMGSVNDVYGFFANWLFHPAILVCVTLLFSFLLIAELPLFSLKFKHFNFKGNEIRYLFLALCILFLFLMKISGVPIIIILYILLSISTTYFIPKLPETRL